MKILRIFRRRNRGIELAKLYIEAYRKAGKS